MTPTVDYIINGVTVMDSHLLEDLLQIQNVLIQQVTDIEIIIVDEFTC